MESAWVAISLAGVHIQDLATLASDSAGSRVSAVPVCHLHSDLALLSSLCTPAVPTLCRSYRGFSPYLTCTAEPSRDIPITPYSSLCSYGVPGLAQLQRLTKQSEKLLNNERLVPEAPEQSDCCFPWHLGKLMPDILLCKKESLVFSGVYFCPKSWKKSD